MSEDWDRYDSFGKLKVYPTRRPENTTTFFTGAGDNVSASTIATGNKLLFTLASADTSKTVDMVFTEDIYVKDGFVFSENAPFGSYYDIEIVHPINGVVGAYAKKAPLLGNAHDPLNADDVALLSQGLTLRVTVYNSSATPSDFKVAGRLEVFRTNTV